MNRRRGDRRPLLGRPARPVVARFAEIVCPPEIRTGRRTEDVLAEFELMLGALPPATRRALLAAFLAFDRGARLYLPTRGRRFARLDDQMADAYLRALLRRRDSLAALVKRLRGMVAMCYYELPEVKEEIGYRPGPFIAAVSRRRLESYGPEIRTGEAAVLAPDPPGPGPDSGSPPRRGRGPSLGSPQPRGRGPGSPGRDERR